MKLEYGSSLIKLLQMDEAPANASSSGLTGADGLRYITLIVDDIEETVTRIEEIGQSLAMPVTTLGHGVKITMVQCRPADHVARNPWRDPTALPSQTTHIRTSRNPNDSGLAKFLRERDCPSRTHCADLFV